MFVSPQQATQLIDTLAQVQQLVFQLQPDERVQPQSKQKSEKQATSVDSHQIITQVNQALTGCIQIVNQMMMTATYSNQPAQFGQSTPFQTNVNQPNPYNVFSPTNPTI